MKRILLLGLTIGSWACAEVVTNTPPWDGVTNVSAWGGNLGTPTYGQAITVPTDGNYVLSDFAFHIFGGVPSIPFNAYVQPWDGITVTGSPLFTASGATKTVSGAASYTFSPDLTLTPGATYLLYLSTLGISQPVSSGLAWGATSEDTHPGGSFAFNGAGQGNPASGLISDLNAFEWMNGISCCNVSDLAFTADFTTPPTSPVLEPRSASLLLVAILAALLAGLHRRRKLSPTN